MTFAADLRSKTALVTGASGGLGLHFARLLARSGANSVLAARRGDEVERASAELRAAGLASLGLAMDVRDDGSVLAACERIEQTFGAIDILVNNAGIADKGMLQDKDSDQFSRVMEVNLLGAHRVARRMAQSLISANRPGTIVNIASILAVRVATGTAAYAVSKAGLVQLTRSMALEWARYGIRVNALAPGYILTDINREYLESEAGKAMMKRIPQRRVGQAADLDGPLLLLVSDASAYMTGSIVTVDGGHSQNAL